VVIRLFPIFFISLTSLLYQILLMKLMSLIQWSNLVTFVLGLAMLGYSAGGVALAIFKDMIEKRLKFFRFLFSTLFSLSAFFTFYLLQRIPLSPQEILWDYKQLLYFFIFFVGLSIPFAAVSAFLGSYYLEQKLRGGRIYFFDLVGAASGSLLAIIVISALGPKQGLTTISSLGLLIACYILFWELKKKYWALFLLLTFLCANFLWPSNKFSFHLSPHKQLNGVLRIPKTNILKEYDDPLSRKTVVESPALPFRYAPGLSLAFQGSIPEQLGLFFDGDSFLSINSLQEEEKLWPYQKYLLEHLPFVLERPRKSVLILGPGGGSNIHQALAMGSEKVDVVGNDPALFSLLKEYPQYTGKFLMHPSVNSIIGDARNYLKVSVQKYDLIQLSLWESQTAHLSGAYTTRPNFLLTVEGIEQVMSRLTERGIVFFSRWIHWPPRDSIRLFNIVIESMTNKGVKYPGKNLALLRSIQTSLLMVSKVPFTPSELQSMRSFAGSKSFDLVYLPDIKKEEVNRYNSNPQALSYEITQDMLGEKKLINRYSYKLSPTTDDRPFFNHFLKLKTFIDLFLTKNKMGIHLLDWDHALLWLTTIMAVFVGLIFILIPTSIYYRKELRYTPQKSVLVKKIIYFSCLGLAFMFIELSLIHKFTLFLGHPIYSVSLVYSSFLFFAGLGSLHSNFWVKKIGGSTQFALSLIVAAIVLIGIVLYYIFIPLLSGFLHLKMLLKFTLCFLNLAPLAYFMGMPFPLGMDFLRQKSVSSVPMVLAANGSFSVIGALGGGLLVVYIGIPATLFTGFAFYLLTPLCLASKNTNPL
jgi:spermidine synthase/MFS family permease